MHRFLHFSVIFFLLVLFSFSEILPQWVTQTSGTTESLMAFKAVDNNIAWTGGMAGKVLKTTDGGATWVLTTANPNAALCVWSIDAINASTAWVSMSNPNTIKDFRIYKTTDGGTSWSQQYANAANFGNGISMFDANYGVAISNPRIIGTEWEIIVTTNGGTNWTAIPNTQYPHASAWEWGSSNCIATFGNTVFFGSNSGKIYKSIDKGNNWSVISSAVTQVADIQAIDFKDANNGILCNTAGEISITSDGGTTWTVTTTALELVIVAGVPGTDIYIAAGLTGNCILSTDNGTTWSPTITGIVTDLLGLDVTNANGWLSGSDGVILKWPENSLPVELSSFTAFAKGKMVDLRWATITERINSGFEIERKVYDNNSPWISIGFREGYGTSSAPKYYSYTDDLNNLNNNSYSYRLKQIDYDGAFKYSQEVNVVLNNLPGNFYLNQNYPNPFNPNTTIEFGIPKTSHVTIKIYDLTGREINTLVDEYKDAGSYNLIWSGTNDAGENVVSGTYICKILTEHNVQSIKMLLLK